VMFQSLREITPFNRLDDSELESLAAHATLRKFRKNALIIQQGDDSHSLYILKQGEMRVFIEDEQGRELTLKILRPGDSFGELALLGDFPRSASVVTLCDCEAWVIGKPGFMQCLRENPELSFALIRSLANMVRETTGELGLIALSDVYGRLAHVLEKYADDQGHLPRFTHRELASMVGSSREMVSKIMKELSKGGYLVADNRQYRLLKKLPSGW